MKHKLWFILTIIIPFIGIVLGIYDIIKGDNKEGIELIILSIVSEFIISYFVLRLILDFTL